MKRLFYSLIPVFFCLHFSSLSVAEPIAGTLEKNSAGTFITLNLTSDKYQILASLGDATEGLNKLSTGDFITGNATLDTTAKTLQLESLDYVGLKKLLGLWYSGENVMNFSSFSNLSVYPLYTFGDSAAANITLKSDFRYSTAPLAGKQWAVFLSSHASTVFATIEFSSEIGSCNCANPTISDFATLRTFNVETGAADKTLRLIRWGN